MTIVLLLSDGLKEDIMQTVETFWRKPATIRLHNGLKRLFLCVEDSYRAQSERPILRTSLELSCPSECKIAFMTLGDGQCAAPSC